MKNAILYVNHMLFFALVVGAIFFTSNKFIDTQVTAKWLWSESLLGIMGIIVSYWLMFKPGFAKFNNQFLFKTIAFLCLCQAIYGLLIYYGIVPSHSNRFVTGSFENVAGFVSCLCFGFPSILYFFLYKENKINKFIYAIGCFVVFFAIFLSRSRCGVLCVVVMFFMFMIYISKKKCYVWIGIIVLIFTLAISYWVKQDSANGRLLIWKCSLEMIKDNPIKGHGQGSFVAHYMDYQADYFKKHPSSDYQMLADNVRHPFNEYIFIVIQYGSIALFMVLLVVVFLMWYCWKYPSRENFICFLSLSCIMLFSCFSYPFYYPFTWIILCMCVFILLKYICVKFKSAYVVRLFSVILFTGSILLLINTMQKINMEMQWKRIFEQSGDHIKENKLQSYYALFPGLRHNSFFLYNYAATLYKYGENKKSLKVANYCRKYFLADYDLELLRADLYQSRRAYKDATECLKQARNMCPSKFIPLYKLYIIYQETNDSIRRDSIADIIVNKKIKINSPVIEKIKKRVSVFYRNQRL